MADVLENEVADSVKMLSDHTRRLADEALEEAIQNWIVVHFGREATTDEFARMFEALRDAVEKNLE